MSITSAVGGRYLAAGESQSPRQQLNGGGRYNKGFCGILRARALTTVRTVKDNPYDEVVREVLKTMNHAGRQGYRTMNR